MPDDSQPSEATVLVLLVEDEAIIHELLEEPLKEAGYEVKTVLSGEDALRELDQGSKDIRAIVTDVNLGGKVTGWQVGTRARELHPEIPVVYMSGASAQEWSAQGVPNSLMIVKPFAPAQIVTAVSQLLTASTTGTPS